MKTVWTTLDSTSSWRKVFKALSLLEHLLKHGNERVIEDARDHMHKLRTLTNFNFYEGSIDRGSGVREKSRNLIEFLKDNERIREERDKARALRDKFAGSSTNAGYGNRGSMSSDSFSSGSYSSGGIGSYSGGIGSYSSGGIGSYSSGGIGSDSFGREKSNRYSDDTPREKMESISSSNIGRYSDEPETLPSRPQTKKIEIKINQTPKASAPSPSPPVPTVPAEIDLLGEPATQSSDFESFAPPAEFPVPSSEFGDFSTHPSFPGSAQQPTQFSMQAQPQSIPTPMQPLQSHPMQPNQTQPMQPFQPQLMQAQPQPIQPQFLQQPVMPQAMQPQPAVAQQWPIQHVQTDRKSVV